MLPDRIMSRRARSEGRIAAPLRYSPTRVSTRTACGSRVIVEGISARAFARLRAWAGRHEVALALVVGAPDSRLPQRGDGAAGAGSEGVTLLVPIGPLSPSLEGRLSRLLGRSGVRLPLCRSFRGRSFADEGELTQVLLEALQLRSEGSAEKESADRALALYVPINVSKSLLGLPDLLSAVLSCAVFTTSFSLGLGFHPVIPVIGFTYGLFGRYLARLRAAIAFDLGDGMTGNTAALAVDAAHGMLLMALVIDPAVGLGLGLAKIAWTSGSHTLSKGALRLFLDKRFSAGREARQSIGVVTTILLDFTVGLLTSLVYAGGHVAFALQAALAVIGLLLLIAGPKSAALKRLRVERRAVMV